MTLKTLREGKFSKVLASYLAIQLFLQMTQPMQLFALTSGPSQPEFNAFTPIGTSDMVNLSTGDFNYNIPVMDVGGYPLNLAYDGGVTMDQEASWVGLGWNLNVGQINRQVRGIPDDFKGDEMLYENSRKDNVTVGITIDANPQFLGFEPDLPEDLSLGLGINLQYNNYSGVSWKPSLGFTFELTDNMTVGGDFSTSATDGVTISPNVNISSLSEFSGYTNIFGIDGKLGVGTSFNSRQGISNLNISSSISNQFLDNTTKSVLSELSGASGYGGTSATISFANPSFTPTKRTPMRNNSFSFSFSTGADAFGMDGEVGFTGYANIQKVAEEQNTSKAYGYENTELATANDVLDFNRENDRTVSKNTTVLPTTVYTHDLYSINGQGIGGMFRPFRSQVGYVFDRKVKDFSLSTEAGLEVEVGSGAHVGFDARSTVVDSKTRPWNTLAADLFKEQEEQPSYGYQKSYFKMIGEMGVDGESSLFDNELYGNKAISPVISSERYNREALRKYRFKTGATTSIEDVLSNNLYRTQRETPNTAISKVSKLEALSDPLINHESLNNQALSHHTVGIKVLKEDGATYVFGETAYNTKKKEVTFATKRTGDCATGLVDFATGENSSSNNSGNDHLYNATTTPAYAHTYMLSAVLSSDYEDRTGDGPSDDDLGAYTKFNYKTRNSNYKWRVPLYGATYDEGFKTQKDDQKANYVYGEKELKYINTIETKTHVAYFQLTEREDGIGTNGENGGAGAGRMYKLDKIFLFSKPEFEPFRAALEGDNPNISYNTLAKAAIKVAHFKYNHSLCENIQNHINYNPVTKTGPGKLTLEKVFFTYRGSEMGRYTPYTFNYEGLNPDYNIKGYDVWGNYKPNQVGGNSCNVNGQLTAPEFPFVQQEDAALQGDYASAWALTSVDLPSGGKLNIDYEADDYQYVQDKKAMQMFKVVGASNTDAATGLASVSNKLYDYDNNPLTNGANDTAKYLVVEIPEDQGYDNSIDFKQRYLGDHVDKPIFFRFLLNMNKRSGKNSPDYSRNEMDYVEGYFKINQQQGFDFYSDGSKVYAFIPMKLVDVEGGIAGALGREVNPITKAGWLFGRRYMNQIVYTGNTTPGSTDVVQIAKNLIQSFGEIKNVIAGPNVALEKRRIARRFMPDKSWIRLQHPNTNKLGGGCRVKQIRLEDQWDIMVDQRIGTTPNSIYHTEYGQEYDYTLEDGSSSSGVATYEPNQSKENPLVMPFYDKDDNDRLIAPKEVSYTETPFGSTFFPSPMVTYSRVTVKNLERNEKDAQGVIIKEVKKHATGKVVNEFYTSKDFPTKTDMTIIDDKLNLDSNNDNYIDSFLQSLLKIKSKNHLALAQGFVIQTNDMNGKQKKQSVYDENGGEISSVSYKYNTAIDDVTQLENKLPVIYKDGHIETDKEIGMHYEVINDFREAVTKTETRGVHLNTAMIPFIVPIVVPLSLLESAKHENVLKLATTTKVIHRTGIMVEKVARDLGAEVSTKNIAWDAATGQVLLTETVNEYDDHYFNMTYPVHWGYKGMNKATLNLGIEGQLNPETGSNPSGEGDNYFSVTGISDLRSIFFEGDEIQVSNVVDGHYWVVGFTSSYDGVFLMNRQGQLVNYCGNETRPYYDFKIIRSGYRNQQMAAMASVTSMLNPIDTNNDGTLEDFQDTTFDYTTTGSSKKLINASAVGYTDFWRPQFESQLPKMKTTFDTPLAIGSYTSEGVPTNYDPTQLAFNPYVYNVRGEWRAIKSYAYLTGRNVTSGNVTTRNEGYFNDFLSFYEYDGTGWQVNPLAIDDTNDRYWTFASEVSQYSPFGAELENKDALDRYSSAQYGYNYTLPMAVASNSDYAQMGYDGFEDYSYGPQLSNNNNNHFTFKEAIPSQLGAATRTEEASHTGRYSIKVLGGNTLALTKDLEACTVPDPLVPDCSTPDPEISVSVDYQPSQNCFDPSHATVTITGEPNQQVDYRLRLIFTANPPGYLCSVNAQVASDTFTSTSGNYTGTITLSSTGTKTFDVDILATGHIPQQNPPALEALLDFPGENLNGNTSEFTVGELCDEAQCQN